ncbi:hypothetical protein BgAZ_209680 [Babesia gibsoni]|uniref:Uncharacterized protein n=1 Tax=Babesia gibsoni TaxID=33632 RepID=A0AAD8PEZ1_BABGI|nr:hypothetical protein BgAZ_209680 [Babesia gibsoni]
METCTSALLSKVSETMNCIFDSCRPPKKHDDLSNEEEDSNATESRKEELKQLVGIFAARAQTFIPCTRIQLETETFVKSQYRLDSELRVLTVQTEDKVLDIPLANVKAVYGFHDTEGTEHQGELMKLDIIKGLDDTQKERLAVVEFVHDGREGQIMLMEEEVHSSDAFITVMRMLMIHATKEN